jgi:hypothetical protein
MIWSTKLTRQWEELIERNNRVRKLMSRRTSPETKQPVYSLGYNKTTAYYGRDVMSRFNGSSLNRKKNKKNVAHGAYITESVSRSNGDVVDNCTKICKHRKSKSKINSLRNAFTNQRPTEFHGSSSEVVRDVPIFKHSPRTKNKIRDKFSAFFRSSQGSNTLVTLSFISAVSDKAAVAILNKFLTALRSESKFDYIWVAERQKNGNIHFHVLMNRLVSVDRGNPLWVLQQYNAGIRHNKYSYDEIVARYKSGTIGHILNPFDVKPVKTIDGLSLYLTKYLSKSNDTFECRVWHCSRGVSKLFTCALIARSTFLETGTLQNSHLDKETGQLYECKTIVTPYAVVRFILNKNYFSEFLNELEQVNRWILNNELPNPLVPEISSDDYRRLYYNC